LTRAHVRLWMEGEYRLTRSYAVVDITAQVDDSAILEPFACVMARARIGPRTRVGAHSVVGVGVSVGADCCIYHHVTLLNCDIGDRCVIHSGVAIGQDGFGFEVDQQTGKVRKKPQELSVRIGNEVEIGANTCIDRGSWRDTLIEDAVKIDNLVQIGHNVQVGANTFICGQAGVAGSTKIGRYCRFGGRSGAVDHLEIGDHVDVAANSVLTRNAPGHAVYAGFPAMPMREWRHQQVTLRRLSRAGKRQVDVSADDPEFPK
jgi:UDP-3-O-[3-hydroxymyristoyl] glucosamine N-acyltransferase LpxD